MNMLFGHAPNTEVAIAAVVLAVILAWTCAEIAAKFTRRLLSRATPTGAPPAAVTRAPVRIVRATLFVLLAVVFIPPVLELFGQPLRTGLRLNTLVQWALDGGLRVLLIVVLAFVFTRLIRITTARFEESLGSKAGPDAIERAKRARTLSHLIRNTGNVFVTVVAALEVLDKFGINIAPILAGASIIGVALGFGAQTLVKDVIGGFFLILENQVRVGDVAEINGTGGLVEAINLRTIVLRDIRGAVHVFPCGSIATLTNLTKDFSYAVLDFRVDYRYDTDRVVDLLSAVAAELQQSRPLGPAMLEPLEVLGVETLGDLGVTIRARVKTVPQRQWEVGRELRRRLKKACEAAGIDLSLAPQRFLVVPNAATPANEATR